MKPLEDYELDEVSGSTSQQELIEFLERVARETPTRYPEAFPVTF